jgi:hypothetical protein
MSAIRNASSLALLISTISCGQAFDQTPISTPESTSSGTNTIETKSTAITWQYPTFSDWEKACDPLPTNRKLNGRLPAKNLLPLTAQEFNKALDAAFLWFKSSDLSETNRWQGESLDSTTFFDTTRVYFENKGVPFTPFAQKLEIEAESKVIIHGDFHGDIHSLNALITNLNERKLLRGFKIQEPNTRFLFLGDYADRGMYGTEVIYTLIRLKLANPDRVHLARGNHEDLSLTARYGFFAELQGKFGRNYDLRKPMRLYDFLPVVIYLGSGDNFLQCNHGGMEPGFSPINLLQSEPEIAYQLLGTLKQNTYLQTHPEFLEGVEPTFRAQYTSMLRDFRPNSPVDPVTLGFMWNDFSILGVEPPLSYNPGRAWVYGQAATQHILKNSSTETHRVRGVIRAHQHSSLIDPMMRRLVACRGIHRHWQAQDSPDLLNADPRQLETILESQATRKLSDGSVFTLNVAPDSAYGIGCGFDFDTYAELDMAEVFTDWTINVHNIEGERW